MTDQISTLASLVAEAPHNGWAPSPHPALYLASPPWQFALSAGWTSAAPARTARLPHAAELKRLADLLVPPPAADAPNWEVVTAALEEAATAPAGQLLAPLADLGRLTWPDTWRTLERLGNRGPTLDGQTFLELLEGQVRSLPDVDPRIPAAMIVTLLRRGGRTLGIEQVSGLVRLSRAVLSIDARSQLEILSRLGIPPDTAEGTLAMMEAAATGLAESDASPTFLAPTPPVAAANWLDKLDELRASIDVDGDTFLDWTKPKKMPSGAYLGIQVHTAIAQRYEEQHRGHGEVMTNSWSVASILSALEAVYAFHGSRLAAALALARPDIFELGLAHDMPPGWVYEIKPAGGGAGAAQAEFEALFYADALTLCGIPVVPGPPGAEGTTGIVPIAHGWAAFLSPMPGVIVYRAKHASPRAIRARNQVPVNSELGDKLAAALKAAGEIAAIAAKAAVLALLAAALVAGGWVLLF